MLENPLYLMLVSSQKAIVNNQPGVTRDRKYGQGILADLNFILIDTAGIDESLKGNTEKKTRQQSEIAINDANIIFFMIDGEEGVLPAEKFFALKI